MNWLAAFLLTLAVELPLLALLAPTARRRRALLDGTAANLLTHPLAWYAVRELGASWWLVEGCVLVVEALVYVGCTRLPVGRAWLMAALANAVTAALSFAV
jgi:hypothetical protein